MSRVYLSGPMSGIEHHNFPAFNAYAALVRAQGHEVVNPAELNPDPAATWEECLRVDIAELCRCDVIALLPGWESSKGAHLELHTAHRLGLAVELLPPTLCPHMPAILRLVVDEVERAKRKFPMWPSDPLHALAVLGEEVGELTKAVLQHTYEPGKRVSRDDVGGECVQVAAMALRWAVSFYASAYEFKQGKQHYQDGAK